jgi:ribosomal protein S18 acetylase RimI-like enzyme
MSKVRQNARSRRRVQSARGVPRFDPLPETRTEAEAIAELLAVRPWLGGEATKSRLTACGSPRVVHLATHVFAPDDTGRTEPGPGSAEAVAWENPLRRTGVALAGANRDTAGGRLTAWEVGGLDLLDTELVVLSACKTALGALHAGEGVFGLRRAFIVAGAKTLVMSLWKVPDLATTFLMDRFYDNLLTHGLDRHLALIAQTDADLFRFVTGGSLEDWIALSIQEWKSPDGIYSYTMADVVRDGPEILGLIISYSFSRAEKIGWTLAAAAKCLPEELIQRVRMNNRKALLLFPAFPADAWYVQNIVVVKKAQEQKLRLGRLMMEAIFTRAHDQGCKECHLDVNSSIPAVKFYEHLGMKAVVETRVPDITGVPMHYRMVKSLED